MSWRCHVKILGRGSEGRFADGTRVLVCEDWEVVNGVGYIKVTFIFTVVWRVATCRWAES
jgi:hypothetical protein